MKQFFGDDLLLNNPTAFKLYDIVKDLPIVDYHCHLSPKEIYEDKHFDDIGELWLAADHYKWRAMRLVGVDEKYITGDASYYEKFLKYASVLPKLAGNPLYYWTQMELKLIFGINKPLNPTTADEIFAECNQKLRNMSAQSIIKSFKVKYIATTDDPIDDLAYHGKFDGFTVAPTFRPDKAFTLDEGYLKKLGEVAGVKIDSLEALLVALEQRLQYFISKGCRISDFGLSNIPDFCDYATADRYYNNRADLTAAEKERFVGFMLCQMAGLAKKYNLVAQWHFSPLRNVNKKMLGKVGVDSGFDVFDNEISAQKLANILNFLEESDSLPKIILYTLNPNANQMICGVSGAFKQIRIGSAWWFNDTLDGTRQHFKAVMEYAALGTHLGMLTDSRSFTSYVRHDFFRRILCAEVAELVEQGQYDIEAAKTLVADICGNNIVEYLGI